MLRAFDGDLVSATTLASDDPGQGTIDWVRALVSTRRDYAPGRISIRSE
jgi:hypothetical protein